MALRTDIASVPALSPAAPNAPVAAVADARQEAFDRAMSSLLGKALRGDVLARLADGSSLVKVAGNTARMMLPAGALPGASVDLTLVSLEPRATFEVGPERTLSFAEAGTAQRSSGSAAALQAHNLPADLLPQIDPRATPTTLSDTARALAAVLGGLKPPSAQAALVARTPLLAAPSGDPAQLAAVLGDAIKASGLFYESHLAEWSRGERPLADLAREPQMQRGFGAAAGEGAALGGDAAQLVNLQLSAQEQSRIAWQGQLWPGQDLHWQVQQDPPERRGDDGAQPAQAWRSTLRLHFPLLGEIGATVVMTGDQLHIELQAAPGAGEALRAHAGTLEGAFDGWPTALASLRIHGQTGETP